MSTNPTNFKYNGLEMNPTTGYTINSVEGLNGINIRTSSDVLTDFDGGNIWTQKYDFRTIVINGVVCGSNATDYFNKKRALINAFSIQPASNLEVTLWDGSTRVINCKTIEQPQIVERSGRTNINEFRVVVLAEKPFFEDEFSQSFTTGLAVAGGGAVPFQIPFPLGATTGGRIFINNIGDIASYPRAILTGVVDTPAVTNLTNGTGFRIDNVLGGSDTVSVERTQQGTFVLKNGTQNYYEFFKGDALRIDPGVNEIVFTGVSGTNENLEVIYKNNYLGI